MRRSTMDVLCHSVMGNELEEGNKESFFDEIYYTWISRKSRYLRLLHESNFEDIPWDQGKTRFHLNLNSGNKYPDFIFKDKKNETLIVLQVRVCYCRSSAADHFNGNARYTYCVSKGRLKRGEKISSRRIGYNIVYTNDTSPLIARCLDHSNENAEILEEILGGYTVQAVGMVAVLYDEDGPEYTKVIDVEYDYGETF